MEHLPNKLLQTIAQVFRDSIPAAGSPSSDSIDDLCGPFCQMQTRLFVRLHRLRYIDYQNERNINLREPNHKSTALMIETTTGIHNAIAGMGVNCDAGDTALRPALACASLFLRSRLEDERRFAALEEGMSSSSSINWAEEEMGTYAVPGLHNIPYKDQTGQAGQDLSSVVNKCNYLKIVGRRDSADA